MATPERNLDAGAVLPRHRTRAALFRAPVVDMVLAGFVEGSNAMRRLMIAAMAIAAGSGGALAADPVAPPAEESGWTITAAPYLWASSLNGDTGLFGIPPQEVDVGFGDIVKHLDMGFMGAAAARNGHFSFGGDIVYARVSADIDSPVGLLATSIDATVRSFMGTAYVGYSILYDDAATVDLVAGARLWAMDNEFDFNGGALNGTTASDGGTWVDPVVGMKFQADIGSDFYLAGWGLIGGFGVASDLMWDVMGGVGYRISDSSSLFAGYRAVDVDYRNDGFVFDMTQHGPIIGGVIRF